MGVQDVQGASGSLAQFFRRAAAHGGQRIREHPGESFAHLLIQAGHPCSGQRVIPGLADGVCRQVSRFSARGPAAGQHRRAYREHAPALSIPKG
jgi:hypothetical protein